MSWTYEIVLRGPPEQRAGLQTWLETWTHDTCAGLPGLSCFDLYTPADGQALDPYNDDGSGPLMILMLDFASRNALTAAVATGRIRAAARTVAPGIAVTGTALERRFYPIGEDATPAPLQAPFSYVVRYHRPADDEAAFVKNYLATHPATEARLPGIRSIMCYLPLEEMHASDPRRARTDMAPADYMIGNEVVFDDIEAFNAAMASPIRQELRLHYRAFPRFTGASTHHAMIRRRLVG